MWLAVIAGLVAIVAVLAWAAERAAEGPRPAQSRTAPGEGLRRGGALRLLAALLSAMGLLFAVGGILMGAFAVVTLSQIAHEPTLAHVAAAIGPSLSGLLCGVTVAAFGQFLGCVAHIEENTRLSRDELSALREHLGAGTVYQDTAEEE